MSFPQNIHATELDDKELIGHIGIESVLLKPYFLLREPQKGEFFLGESSFSVSWTLKPNIKGIFRIGSQSLIHRTSFYEDYNQEDIEQVSVFEGYAEYISDLGRVRFGLIPILYGYEGGLQEGELDFQRSLLFQKRIVAMRDYGLSFSTWTPSYFTDFSVHNGESRKNQDGRIWITARWGWNLTDKSKLGFMGQTGTMTSEVTQNSVETLAGFDPSLKDSKLRLGGVFYALDSQWWQVIFEGQMGELFQNEISKGKFATGHLDLIYNWSRYGSWMLRGDYLDPHHKTKDDAQTAVTLGYAVKNYTSTSVLYVMATKNYEEGEREINNDEFRLVWKLTPLID